MSIPVSRRCNGGKLVLNLTNAVNALSGLGLRDMLLDRGWRRVMAAQMREALAVLKVAGIEVRVPAAAPGWVIPWILRLPTPVFARVAAPMLTVDALARTSMVADLESGRKTEIDHFQGKILELGSAHDVQVPVNARVLELVKQAETRGARRIRWPRCWPRAGVFTLPFQVTRRVRAADRRSALT